MDLGPHAAIIIACYVAVGTVVALLTLWLLFDGHRLTRQLAALERRGVRRRSAAPPELNPRD